MNPEVQKVIADLESIESLDAPGALKKLDDAVQKLVSSENAELGIDVMLGLFERFPDKGGSGIFWSIVHGLEALPGYEEKLIESVRRQPSEFSLLMVNRILNAGMTEVKGINLMSVLKDVAADEREPEEIRREAQGYVEWQERKK